jgi:hypothetical protein
VTSREKGRTVIVFPATKDLFRRLRPLGFDEQFVRRFVLPDWWDDSLASTPANRAIAEMAISRHLGVAIKTLREPAKVLEFPTIPNVCLKRNKNLTFDQVRASIFVAQRAALLACENLKALPDFSGIRSAKAVRREILQWSASVNLSSLIEYCWKQGIVVIHLAVLPRASKKIQGMALFVADRPVIVLASGYDAPPKLAFHLVHELGHIFLRHVRPGDGPLADGNLDNPDENQDEKDADSFACEILTGHSDPKFKSTFNLTAKKLADAARSFGNANKIDPGAVALCYGYYNSLFGAATAALKILGMDVGAHQIISTALRNRLDVDNMPTSSERFLAILTATSESPEDGRA